ncbi:MAG: histidine phosphatase family protein, partial [Desulfobacula sp.]|nr:histidine phosphatase family protein [Desulfobacula sp.]
IFLVRHGQTEWNLQNRLQGHKNSPLTIKGREQALKAKKALREYEIHRAYVSPLQRARETSNIILGDRQIKTIQKNNLKEMNLGPWEGKTREEIKKSHPDKYYQFWNNPDKFYLPQAETYQQLQNRVVMELNDIFLKGINKNTLVVSHWIAIKVSMAHYSSIPINKLSSLTDMENGKFATLVNENGNVTINGSDSHCF